MRYCDYCEHYFGEWCYHPEVKEKMKNDTMFGDLWNQDNTPSWCPLKLSEADSVSVAKRILRDAINRTLFVDEETKEKLLNDIDKYTQ